MKKYITIAGAALLGHASAQENLAAAELSVESPNPQVYLYGGYVDPLYQPQHQLKEQAYLETMQKIYGTKVYSPQVQAANDDPLADVLRETKQADYLQMLQNIQDGPVPAGPNPLGLTAYQLKEQAILKAYQNIYGNNVQQPKVQQDPLSDVEREMKQATYLSGMQNIYGHYAKVQSSKRDNFDPLFDKVQFTGDWRYYDSYNEPKIYDTSYEPQDVQGSRYKQHPVDPLAKTEWELKQQAYLEALQKIYGNKVQSGNPLSDLEREMKQATYLSGMQNIYDYYAKVQQSPEQEQRRLKQLAYLNAPVRFYGQQVQSGNPLADVERELKQATYLSGIQNIYGHYPLVESFLSGQIMCIRAPCPSVESTNSHWQEVRKSVLKNPWDISLLENGQTQVPQVQNENPLADVERELKQAAYLEGLERIHGHLTPLVQNYNDKSEMRSTRRYTSDWEDDE
ncbi:UNKNOWN [Stylonychia lemnae]|uniref:Uncharacterized protein n=1 Tax=Stylonychia lemnae TaxID=5949 RepID=A0A078A000_STYLE|nr:UNKNOWN [Stylonychia lemnae]|eukprot:CDW75197.1 UNKNOWN [Stylonychia lemnae]